MKLSDFKEEDYGGGNGGGFLKLNPGDNKVRIVSEFAIRNTHYVDNKSSECIGEGCPLCANSKAGSRFLCHVIDRADGQFKLGEFGVTILKQLKALSLDPQYQFDVVPNYDVNIKKQGTGLDTEYTVVPDRSDTQLTEAEKEQVSKLDSPNTIVLAMVNKQRKKLGVATTNQEGEKEIQVDDIPF